MKNYKDFFVDVLEYYGLFADRVVYLRYSQEPFFITGVKVARDGSVNIEITGESGVYMAIPDEITLLRPVFDEAERWKQGG